MMRKIKEPMFPRLHVNDTEEGGPRAPPRNKMALYEQFSIPSQRFNPGALPLKPSSQVQRSFAESPHLLLEDGAYLGKSLTGSAKKHPLEYIVKTSRHIIVKHKDDDSVKTKS